jgi:hypothetical protein
MVQGEKKELDLVLSPNQKAGAKNGCVHRVLLAWTGQEQLHWLKFKPNSRPGE